MFGCSDVYHWMGRTAKAVCLPDCGKDLAKARAYEFAFVMQPLKLQGATGSTVAPTAIR